MIEENHQRIINWIEQEGWKHEILQDDDTVFNIVVHPNQTQNVNVVMQKIQSQKMTIITNMKFRDIDIKAYLLLSDDAKREFIMNLEILLIQINIIYNIFPNPPKEVHGIEMSKHIYFDGLTRDRFFDSIVAVLRGLRVVQMNYDSLSPVNPSDTSIE